MTAEPSYDRDGDRLVIPFRPRVPAYSQPVSDYVALRRSLDTDEIIGAEIERFSRAVPQRRPIMFTLSFGEAICIVLLIALILIEKGAF